MNDVEADSATISILLSFLSTKQIDSVHIVYFMHMMCSMFMLYNICTY